MAIGGGGMSSSVGLGFVMGLTDDVSGPASRIGAAVVTLRTRIQALQTGFLVLGGALTGLGAGLGSVLMRGVKDAAAFEVQMRMLQSITGLTWQETKSLGDEFDRITATLPMSSSELASMAIAAGKLGIATKGGVDALKEVAIQATYMGKALGFSGEESINMIGRLGTVFGLLDPGAMYKRWDEAQKKAYKTASTDGEKAAIVQDQLMRNVKGTSAALTQMSFASSRSADFLSDVSIRAGQGAQMMEKTAAETIGLAGILADIGVRAEAGGTALGRFFDSFRGNMKGYEKMIKVFGEDNIGLGIKELQNLAKNDPSEAVNRLLEAMGKAKFMDPVAFSDMSKELGLSNVRIKQVVLGLADAGGTMVKVNKEMLDSFIDLDPTLETLVNRTADGGAEISRLRWMQLMSTKAFEEGAKASQAYNNVAQTTSMLWATLAGSVTNVSKKLGGMLLPAIQGLLQSSVNMMGKLFDLNDTFFKIAAAVLGVTSAILTLSGTVILAASAWIMFGGFITAALWPALIIVGLVTAAVGAFALALKALSKEGEGIFDTLGRLVEGTFDKVLDFAKGFTETWDIISDVVTEPWKEAMDGVRGTINMLKELLPGTIDVGKAFTKLGGLMSLALGRGVLWAGKLVQKLSADLVGFTLGMRLSIGDGLKKPLDDIWTSLSRIGAAFSRVFGALIPDSVKDATGEFGKFRDMGGKAGAKVLDVVTKVAEYMEKLADKTEEAVKYFVAFSKGSGLSKVSGYAQELTGWFSALIEKSGVLASVQGLWGDIWAGLKARAIPTLQGMISLVRGVSEGIGGSTQHFGQLIANMKSGIGSFGAMFKGVSQGIGTLTGVLGAYLGGIISKALPDFLGYFVTIQKTIMGILRPASQLTEMLGAMPLRLGAFGKLGEGIGKMMGAIFKLADYGLRIVGSRVTSFFQGFVEGFGQFIAPIGEAFSSIAEMAGMVFGLIGDMLSSIVGETDEFQSGAYSLGGAIGSAIGGALKYVLIGVMAIITAFWTLLNVVGLVGNTIWMVGHFLSFLYNNAGAVIDLIGAKFTNMFNEASIAVVNFAAKLGKYIVQALSEVPLLGDMIDVDGALEKIENFRVGNEERARSSMVGDAEMAQKMIALAKPMEGVTKQANDMMANISNIGEGFSMFSEASKRIANKQEATAQGVDKIGGILAKGQTNIGQPKPPPKVAPSPIMAPGLLASMSPAQAAPVIDPAPIAAAISNVTVDPTIENTVAFTAMQNYTLHATAVFPGLADKMRAIEQRLAATERRQVVTQGEN